MGRFVSQDPTRQEANLFLYTNSNPINYFDPSGYITEGEAADADRVVKSLKTFGITIVNDWGYRNRYVPGSAQIGCSWEDGIWDLQELHIIAYSVEILNNNLHGKFNSFVGPVTFNKTPSTCGRGCTTDNSSFSIIEFMDIGRTPASNYDPSKHITDSGINFDVWSVVHELGHAWDQHHNWNLSSGLMSYTTSYYDAAKRRRLLISGECDPQGRLPGCNKAGYFFGGVPPKGSSDAFNAEEDFAESVAAYVFPDAAHSELMKFLKGIQTNSDPDIKKWYLTYYNLFYYSDYRKTSRWDYIDSKINPTAH